MEKKKEKFKLQKINRFTAVSNEISERKVLPILTLFFIFRNETQLPP